MNFGQVCLAFAAMNALCLTGLLACLFIRNL